MRRRRASRTAAAAAVALLALPALAQEGVGAPAPTEIEALRREVEDLRAQIRLLQEQVRGLLAGAGNAAVAAPPTEPPAAPPPATPPPAGGAGPTRAQSLLNPAISAVFQTIGDTSLARADEGNGFDLSEAEIAFQSVVDPYAKVDLYLSIPAGETPEIEEGAVTTLALPGSLQLKGGRFKNAFGRWNTLHTHAFPTVERPDALEAFLGEESLTTDGLSLSALVPNPWGLYLDVVAEAGTAREGPAFNSARRRLTYLGHVTASFSTSANATIETGLTAARGWTGLTAARGWTGPGEALEQALASPQAPTAPSPRSAIDAAVQGIDLTYKWKPLQLNVYRSFLWQTEVLRSHRGVDVLTASGTLEPAAVTSLGGYSYVETQFTRRWRQGLRVDVTGLPDLARARIWSASGVVRFQPSEFQELRLQVKRTRRDALSAALFDGDRDDTRVLLEWIPVIGAHGAHKY